MTTTSASVSKTHRLNCPLIIGDKTITEVTLRRPKARDMIKIGDHLPVMSEMSERVAAEVAMHPDDKAAGERAVSRQMNGKVFEAMVAIAANLADLGDAAMDLDFEDLAPIAMGALSTMGE